MIFNFLLVYMKKKINNNQFQKLVTIVLIIGIITASGFIIYYLLKPEPGFVVFGILNSEKKAENYPTSAKVGENISFYVTVNNQMNRDFSFRVKILKGNNKTELSSKGSFNATSFLNLTQVTLNHDQFWMSPKLNISFSIPGANQSIITELWEIPSPSVEKYFNILYLKLVIFP